MGRIWGGFGKIDYSPMNSYNGENPTRILGKMHTLGDKARLKMAPRRDERFSLPALGEWYEDLLTYDAWINNRSKATQAQSLLCAKLQEREERIYKRIAELAAKRGISLEEMKLQILTGKAQRMTVEDVEEVMESND